MNADHPLLFVTVGADRYPFPRLLRWVQAWLAGHRQWRVEVQHGVSPPPPFGHAFAYATQEETRRLLRMAAIVVADAAPTTITRARELGHVPVVVARDPALGEAADDYQIHLSRTLGAAGSIWLAESESGLGRAIAAALAAAATDGDTPGPTEEFLDMRRGPDDRGPRAPGRDRARIRRMRR